MKAKHKKMRRKLTNLNRVITKVQIVNIEKKGLIPNRILKQLVLITMHRKYTIQKLNSNKYFKYNEKYEVW